MRQSKLPAPVPKWRRVPKNIYSEPRPPKPEHEALSCWFKTELTCRENAAMNTECAPPFRPGCTNCELQTQAFAPTRIIKSIPFPRDIGDGLITKGSLHADEYIGEYRGRQVTTEQRLQAQAKATPEEHLYYIQLQTGFALDAKHEGTDLRLINHSCNPNC